MASPIGRPGPKKGPSRTSMRGARQNPGNLGRSTSLRSNTGTNKDPVKGIQRARINAGPGGSQRP